MTKWCLRISGTQGSFGTVPIIHMVLNHPNIPSPNMPISPGSLTTALHVASETGRVDVGRCRSLRFEV